MHWFGLKGKFSLILERFCVIFFSLNYYHSKTPVIVEVYL